MNTTEVSTFAQLLRRYRLAAGLTQEALAERATLSARAVSDLERGIKRAPYRYTVDLLADALELDDAERTSLHASIQRQRKPSAPLQQTSVPASTIPLPLTPLIGREREEAQVVQLLRREGTRLLTLTGTGGVGETRLALQVAATLQGDFPDGVVVVSLAPIHDPGLVLSSIASALGVREAGDQPLLTGIITHLQDKHTLLLLDNFEQVVEAAPQLVELLAGCPGLRMLATSRVRLHVRGEQEVEVLPLAVPGRLSSLTPEELLLYPAVALFVYHTQVVNPDFELRNGTGQVVAEICRRLDGLPLAIELAAARIKVLPASALLARLERRLQVLTGGPRDLPARQQTMRATIAWSYSLLNEREKLLFRRLAVFVGGCDLEAAEAVCLLPDRDEVDPLSGLSALVDQSLVTVDKAEEAEPRFGMLETVREFGLERLEQTGERDAVERAHAAYFFQLAEAAQRHLTGPEQKVWLDRLEQEHDNLRAAFSTAQRSNDIEVGLKLVGAVWHFWLVRGHFEEGRRWVDVFLSRSDSAAAPTAPRANALCAGGVLAFEQGYFEQATSSLAGALDLAREIGDDRSTASAFYWMARVENDRGNYRRAEQWLEESLGIQRRLDDQAGVCAVLRACAGVARLQGDFTRATALYWQALALGRAIGDVRTVAFLLQNLGDVATEQGAYDRSISPYEESLALFRDLGDSSAVAGLLYRMADVAMQAGDYAQTERLYDESLELYRSLGSRYGIAMVLVNQAEAALATGDLARARTLAEKSLLLFRDRGDRRCAAVALMRLADTAREQDDYEQALSFYQESVRVHWELNTRPELVQCLERMARLASARRQGERAARLHGALQSLREAMKSTMTPADRPRYDRDVAAARDQIGKMNFAAAEVEGRSMTLDEAVRYCLAWDPGQEQEEL